MVSARFVDCDLGMLGSDLGLSALNKYLLITHDAVEA